MDERALRQNIAQAARELWMRGLIVADGGLISAEVHRRRYMVTPPGLRRSAIREEDMAICDIGGVQLSGDGAMAADARRDHRIAYQIGLERQLESNPPLRESPIRATVQATPPMTLALLRRTRANPELKLPGLPVVQTVDGPDEAALRRALLRTNVVALGEECGLLCLAGDVWEAVNLIERIEHAATVELACRYEP